MAGQTGAGRISVDVEGRELSLSNLDKQLYPAAGFRKADVVDYYRRIAAVMLPHLAGRPPTLVRAPNGAHGERFFEKRCPPHHPSWVRVSEPLEPNGGQQSCVVEDLPTLVWLANLAALELHTNQWRLPDVNRPRAVVLDLDPGAPADVLDCCRVALELRDLLDHLGMVAVVKTSGGKGLHISVPLNNGKTKGARVDHDKTKEFALALGQLLVSRDKKRVTVEMAKADRKGKVFVDWSQNDRHKTTVCAYSLRIAERPTVSTPVSWAEIEHAVDTEDRDALTFEAPAVLERISTGEDYYHASLTEHQDLPSL
ncbi:MAG TPA: non-homologous end-joining DNA ligase [Acidimicrobiia bacterium]|nr:non-homologous end-joining DNA ligase [Acidimicrobiia bacterium]